MFPVIIERKEDAHWLREAFAGSGGAELIEQGIGFWEAVMRRTWSFLCVRKDGMTANWPSATRAKNPMAHLLAWADTVGGRLRSSWKELAAVNQDKQKQQPPIYKVSLHSANRSVWESEVYALDPDHAAMAVAEKLPLEKALRQAIDRIAVQGPEGTWQAYRLDDFYSEGEMVDALAALPDMMQRQLEAAQRGRSLVSEDDAALLVERDWLNHPLNSFQLWRAEREQSKAIRDHARVA